MAVFKHALDQKRLVWPLVWSLWLAFALFVGLMVWHGSRLAGPTLVTRSQLVNVGPLALGRLTKAPAAHAEYRVTIQLLPGICVYTLAWLSMGGAWSAARLLTSRAPLENSS